MVHNPLIPVRPAISLGGNWGHFARNEELVGSLEPCFRPFFSADAVGPGCPARWFKGCGNPGVRPGAMLTFVEKPTVLVVCMQPFI